MGIPRLFKKWLRSGKEFVESEVVMILSSYDMPSLSEERRERAKKWARKRLEELAQKTKGINRKSKKALGVSYAMRKLVRIINWPDYQPEDYYYPEEE